MKNLIIAAFIVATASTPAPANLLGGDVDLPETPVVSREVGNGMRCVWSTFPGDMKVLELVQNYQAIAAATFIKNVPISAREAGLLIKHCRDQ